jgi:imidazole glycerol-phosphate synthase subunit HisF
MKKKRLIPILLLKNGWLVQSRQFKRHQNLGNPITAVRRLSQWGSDELIYLDISRDDNYDIRRDDQGYKNRNSFLDIIKDISKETFMPISIGGKVGSLEDIESRLKLGADKVVINTKAFENIKFIEDAAKEFGSQCIVVSVDVKKINNNYRVFVDRGRKDTKMDSLFWVKEINNFGAGEILLNSIDRDGTGEGYDLDLLKIITDKVTCPVIACGGVGSWDHFEEAFRETNVDAVSAANIFQYIDQSVYLAKKYLYEKKINIRKPDILKI